MKKYSLIVILLAAGYTGAFAQHKEDFNFNGEKKRVKTGIENHKINRKEGVAIYKQAQDVRTAKRVARKDGTITPRERARIARQDWQLDKTIYKAKHN